MIEFHATLIVKEVSEKCTSFAKHINAIRLSGKLIHKQILSAIAAANVAIDSEHLYERVRAVIENEGIDIK